LARGRLRQSRAILSITLDRRHDTDDLRLRRKPVWIEVIVPIAADRMVPLHRAL
jgi:hypothetical protein